MKIPQKLRYKFLRYLYLEYQYVKFTRATLFLYLNMFLTNVFSHLKYKIDH